MARIWTDTIPLGDRMQFCNLKELPTPADLQEILRACPNWTAMGTRNRALIVTFSFAGLRVGEVLRLREGDVNQEDESITVRNGTSGASRTILLGPFSFSIIHRWLDQRRLLNLGPDVPFFSTRAGRPLSPSYIRTLLPRLARQAAILKRVNARSLRRAHAADLLVRGMSEEKICDRLGHATVASTERYLRGLPRPVCGRLKRRSACVACARVSWT